MLYPLSYEGKRRVFHGRQAYPVYLIDGPPQSKPDGWWWCRGRISTSASRRPIRQRRGGIIWHSQGTGKSIVMVLLAKWILENNPHARDAVSCRFPAAPKR